jgi:propionate catabolism operon transcriptional regulator
LDELGDASPTLQGALIGYLDSGEIRRVGSDEPITVDARVIVTAAAGLDSSAIRPELRSRLAGDVVVLPPLRARVEDATLLASHLVRDAMGPDASLHWRAALALLRATWPGNVRQLRQVVDRMVDETGGELPVRMSPEVEALLQAPAAPEAAALPADPDGIELPPRRLSKQRLRELLREHTGNVTAIASHLGIGRNTLYRWLKTANLDIEDFRP